MSKKLCVALGDFDGVHLGHRKVLLTAVNNTKSFIPAVYTFTSNCKGYDAITDNKTKQKLINALGIKHIVFDDFNAVRDLSPAEFVNDILKNRLNAKIAVCGEDFKFGKGASGDINSLKQLCAQNGIDVISVKEYTFTEKKLSSSYLRSLIKDGNVEIATKLMGHRFTVTGEVIHGKQLGQKNDVPTLNSSFKQGIIVPAYGVYVTQTVIDGQRYKSISNVGIRPSVENTHTPNIETHLLDYSGDLYGKEITVEFIKILRAEIKFENKELLFKQISKDIDTAKKYFNGENNA